MQRVWTTMQGTFKEVRDRCLEDNAVIGREAIQFYPWQGFGTEADVYMLEGYLSVEEIELYNITEDYMIQENYL